MTPEIARNPRPGGTIADGVGCSEGVTGAKDFDFGGRQLKQPLFLTESHSAETGEKTSLMR